ncbi:hypothetical protein AB0D84_29730 [Streptomyces sp. NPDC048193]|uniref:hypothetical protein n=1 Tax=Streptomyces sp. NPDC048193 TaxID=3155630 RepID=UPI003438D149
MDPSAGFVRDFVGGVLDEFEKLTVSVSALRDTTLTIGVFGDEAGVHGIRLQNTGGLFEDGFDHR